MSFRSQPAILHRMPSLLLPAAVALLTVACGGGGASQAPVGPTVAAIEPASGPPGTEVTLSGRHFDRVTAVSFGGEPLAAGGFTVDSPTRIRVRVPAGAASGVFRLGTAAGHVDSPVFTVVPAQPAPVAPVPEPPAPPPPAPEAVAPVPPVPAMPAPAVPAVPVVPAAPAPSVPASPQAPPTLDGTGPLTGAPGEPVTLTGTGLDQITGASYAGLPLDPGSLHLESPTRIRVRIPLRAATGGSFTLTWAAGTLDSQPIRLALLPPTLTGAVAGSARAGTEVAITGTHLASATEVRFGNRPAAGFRVESPERIVATVPEGRGGRIRVTTLGGSVESPADFDLQPVITRIAPLSGPPGSEVVLAGSGLTAGAEVRFGDTWTPYFADSPDEACTELRVRVPTGAAPGPITVATPGGSCHSAQAFTVVYEAPVLTAMAPAEGVAGTEVTFTGFNLDGVADLRYGGTPLFPGTWQLDTRSVPGRIRATVPVGAATGAFTLTNPAGAACTSAPFTVRRLPNRAALLEETIPMTFRGWRFSRDYPASHRARQYGILAFPKAPVFHAYHPYSDDGTGDPTRAIRPGHIFPGFPLHLRLPADRFLEVLPPGAQAQLGTLPVPANPLELHVVCQDQPYLGQMLFRPHCWLYPKTPELGTQAEGREAWMGLYTAPGAPVVQFAGAAPGAFLPGPATLVHPAGDAAGPPSMMVSSSNTHQVAGLDFEATRTLWSLVHDQHGPVLPGRTAATLHLLLDDQDQEALAALAGDPAVVTFRDLLRAMHASPVLGPASGPAPAALTALAELVRPRLTGAQLADPPRGPGGPQPVVLLGSGFSGAFPGSLPEVTVDGIAATGITVADDRIEATIAGLAPAPSGTRVYVVRTEPFLEAAGSF